MNHFFYWTSRAKNSTAIQTQTGFVTKANMWVKRVLLCFFFFLSFFFLQSYSIKSSLFMCYCHFTLMTENWDFVKKKKKIPRQKTKQISLPQILSGVKEVLRFFLILQCLVICRIYICYFDFCCLIYMYNQYRLSNFIHVLGLLTNVSWPDFYPLFNNWW